MEGNDNDIFIMIISVTMVLLILVGFIVSFLFIYKNRQMRNKAEMDSVKEKYNQEILTAQLEIKEQTLKNVSEEIHDNVGQVLSLVVLNLSSVDLNDGAKAAVKIENTTKLVEKVVADLRNLSKTMDAENIATLGLSAIIRFELDLLEKTGIYHTSLKLSGEEKRLNGSRELVLYRIIQESLNNIIKHAEARAVSIEVTFSTIDLCIEITDNGKGFENTRSTKTSIYNSGAGIKNMTRRASLIGGSLVVKSLPLEGTTVRVTVPFT